MSVLLDWDAVSWHTVTVGGGEEKASVTSSSLTREESGTWSGEDRSLVWRGAGCVLYLVEHNLDAHLQHCGVRLVFPSPVLPDPSFFFSPLKQHLRMLLVTSDGSLHRFTFEAQFGDSVFVSICNFSSLMAESDVRIPLPSSIHERFDNVMHSLRPFRICGAFQDASIVGATRSGALILCTIVAGGSVVEHLLSEMDVAGIVTLQQPRDEAFTFTLSRDGLFSGFSISSRTRFVSLQLTDRDSKVRGIGLRMFVRDSRRVNFVALVQAGGGVVQFQTVRADFSGSSIAVEHVASEALPSSSLAAVVDYTEGPAGLVCLHSDGSVSCKVAGGWQAAKAASLGHVVPSSSASQAEWAHFCLSLKTDPYVSKYLLRVVHFELAQRGFVGEEDDLATAMFNIANHEREATLNVFLECYKQTRLGSSIGRLGNSGLPILVGPGGLSVLFPLPPLAMWPEVSEKRRIFDLCRATDAALSPEQWLDFDAEAFLVGPEEACLTAMRQIVITSLPLELPLLWARFEEGEGLASLGQLLGELCESTLPPDVWNSQLSPISSANISFSGPIPTHAAACAIRSGVEGNYLLLRSLLLTMYSLLASHHVSVRADQRNALRSNFIPKSILALRSFSNLRTALRCPNSGAALVASSLPFASASRCLATTLSSLCQRFSSNSNQSIGIASFALYALFVALRAPVLYMRALNCCREFDALAGLSGTPAAASGSTGALQQGDVAAQFFGGVARLRRNQSAEAFAAFCSAITAAQNQGSTEYLARVSGDLAVANFVESYFLNVVSLFEKQNNSEMVVKTAQFALGMCEDENKHIFLSKSFRHNLKLKNFAEAYLNILSSSSADVELRKLRKFVVEICAISSPAILCEFPFVGRHNLAVVEILGELAAMSDWKKDLNYSEVLYSFLIFRGNFREAASAAYSLAAQMRCDLNIPPTAIEQSLNLAVSALRLAKKQFILLPKDLPLSNAPKRSAPESEEKKNGESQRIITLIQMQQELALASARAVLPRFHTLVSPNDAFSLLVSAGRISHAISLASVFSLDMSAAFEKMTRNALRNSPLLGDATDEMADAVSNGKSSWTNLESLVRQHDSRKSNYSYAKTVARTLLSEGAEKLPAWLAQFLAENHAEALIQIYLSFSMLNEAHAVAMVVVTAPNQLVPFNLIDKLLASREYDQPKQLAIQRAIAVKK